MVTTSTRSCCLGLDRHAAESTVGRLGQGSSTTLIAPARGHRRRGTPPARRPDRTGGSRACRPTVRRAASNAPAASNSRPPWSCPYIDEGTSRASFDQQRRPDAHRVPVARRPTTIGAAGPHPGDRVVERSLRSRGVDHDVVLLGRGSGRRRAAHRLRAGAGSAPRGRRRDRSPGDRGDRGKTDRPAADHEDAGTGLGRGPVHRPRDRTASGSTSAPIVGSIPAGRHGTRQRRSTITSSARPPSTRHAVQPGATGPAQVGLAGQAPIAGRRTTRWVAPRPLCRRRARRRTRGPA